MSGIIGAPILWLLLRLIVQRYGDQRFTSARSLSLNRIIFDGHGGAKAAELWDVGHRIRDVEEGPDGSLWMLEDANRGALTHVIPSPAVSAGGRAAVRRSGTELPSRRYLEFFENCRRNLAMSSWEGGQSVSHVLQWNTSAPDFSAFSNSSFLNVTVWSWSFGHIISNSIRSLIYLLLLARFPDLYRYVIDALSGS